MRCYCPGEKAELELETTSDEPKSGGEGAVHLIKARPGLVAKIFKEPTQHHRREKVEELIKNPFLHDPPGADGHRRFAMPQSVLLDVTTWEFVGCTIPHIPASLPLDDYIVPGGKGYRAERSFRIGLAIAVADLIAEVHQHHLMLVVGDLKPQNILADDRGRVSLIDLDSVQLTTLQGRTFVCPVVSAHYTAPEVSGTDPCRVPRGREADLFALAVIIFQILFGGWHPFQAVNNGVLEDRIRGGDWPYAEGSRYRPPPQAPPFEVPVAIRELFTKAFVVGHADPTKRPPAQAWLAGLKRHQKALEVGRRPKVQFAPLPGTLAVGRRKWRVAPQGGMLPLGAAAAAAAIGAACLIPLPRWGGADDTQVSATAAELSPAGDVAAAWYPPPTIERRLPRPAAAQTPAYWRRLRDGAGPLSFDTFQDTRMGR